MDCVFHPKKQNIPFSYFLTQELFTLYALLVTLPKILLFTFFVPKLMYQNLLLVAVATSLMFLRFGGGAAQTEPTAPVLTAPAESLYEKLEGTVENKLVAPLRKKDNRKAMRFSRCPSGYDAEFNNLDFAGDEVKITPAEDGWYYGEVEYYNACDGHKICEFRVDAAAVQVEARNGLGDEFVSARTWLHKHEENSKPSL